MSQKRNNTDGFPARTGDCLDILGSYIESKEVCTVSWRSDAGGIYQCTTVLRDIFQKKKDWILALEAGPLIPVRQISGVRAGT